jgi:hypothetical protein
MRLQESPMIAPDIQAHVPDQSSTFLERLGRSRLGQWATKAALALSVTGGVAAAEAIEAAPAHADSSQPWDTPTNSEHTYVNYVVWADTPNGKSLHVYVSGRGKFMAAFDPNKVYSEARRDAHIDPDDPHNGTLQDQLDCHAIAAPPNKKSWNLDWWRVDPGLIGTLNDECNPGGNSTVGGDIE